MAPTVLPGIAQQMQQPQAQQEPGLLNSLGNMFSGGGGMGSMTPQQQMMLSLGAGMLANSRKRPGEAFGAAVPQAMQTQMMAQKLFSEDEEKKRKERARQALGQFVTSPGVQNQVPEAYRQAFGEVAQTDPETAWQLYGTLNKQGEVPAKIQWAQWALNQDPKTQARLKELGLMGDGGVTVNLPNGQPLPEGVYGIDGDYEIRTGDKGQLIKRPIEGTKAWYDARKSEQALKEGELQAGITEKAQEQQTRREGAKNDIVNDDASRAINLLKEKPLLVAGPVAQVLQNFWGSDVADLQALTGSLRAITGFKELQAMRDASPTGGALGPVSDRENALLQQTLGALEASQGSAQQEYNLKRFVNVYNDIVHGEGKGPERYTLPKSSNDFSTMSDEELMLEIQQLEGSN